MFCSMTAIENFESSCLIPLQSKEKKKKASSTVCMGGGAVRGRVARMVLFSGAILIHFSASPNSSINTDC